MVRESTMETLRIAEISDGSTERALPGHKGSRKAVFIDRDGVINEDTVHLHKVEDLRMIDGAREAIEGFRELGFLPVIVTNQAGIGKALYDQDDFIEVMNRISERLGGGPPWERVFFSPFHTEAVIEKYRRYHQDRKPEPGMLLRAAFELDLDIPSSVMVGDHIKDISAAHRAGCRGVLVMTGRGKDELKLILDRDLGPGDEEYPDLIVQDLYGAYLAVKEEMEGEE